MTEKLQLGGLVQSFDEDKRELVMRVVPWGVEAETARGVEVFERGAFEGLDPASFILRPFHEDPPTGRGTALEETDDWLLMTFKVAQTGHGDEQLTLVREGVTTGVSVEFEDGEVEKTKGDDGRIRFLHRKVKPNGQLGVATTYKPAFREAAVLQVREEPITMPEIQETAPEVTQADADSAIAAAMEPYTQRITALEDFKATAGLGLTAPEVSSKAERKVEIQLRELAEVITTPNQGVLPPSWSSEMLGRIATGRPFMQSTREVPPPATGMQLIYPKLTQGPLVATQAAEKDELASQATAITTVAFGMVTKGGAADLSMQLIRRSSPEFLSLFLELLGEAYAVNSEDGAVDALLAAAAVVEGGEFDPDAPVFGAAFGNTNTATGGTMKPDRIWLSTAALIAFIDSRTPTGGGGTPTYPALSGIGGLTGGGGSELGFNLTPVWVPALDDEAVDLIIGPSRGFVWAEDGTYTLQADVPGKFGRDIGLAGMLWYAPIYPAAFTSYTLGS